MSDIKRFPSYACLPPAAENNQFRECNVCPVAAVERFLKEGHHLPTDRITSRSKTGLMTSSVRFVGKPGGLHQWNDPCRKEGNTDDKVDWSGVGESVGKSPSSTSTAFKSMEISVARDGSKDNTLSILQPRGLSVR